MLIRQSGRVWLHFITAIKLLAILVVMILGIERSFAKVPSQVRLAARVLPSHGVLLDEELVVIA